LECVLVALIAGAAGVASAEDARIRALRNDQAALRAAVEAGRKASFFCVNCHGDNGVSRMLDVPNLAGQNPDYVLEQTRKFGNGTRKDEFMQGLIKLLSEEQKLQIAVFYATQHVPPGRQDAALVKQGKQFYQQFCSRCHGNTARGNEIIPRLAGQHTEYLELSIGRYKKRTGERVDPLMFNAVVPLNSSQIKAIAAYLNTLP
jgi:cytochrome c553